MTIWRLFIPTVDRGVFCQFPFQWIYYFHSTKSTGKETGKMHLCALFYFQSTKIILVPADAWLMRRSTQCRLFSELKSNLKGFSQFYIDLKIRLCLIDFTVHRGAFYKFPFWWIYYCHSRKSTGKETGKMHLCAVCESHLLFYTVFETK